MVHNFNVHRPLEVYRYFKDIDARYLMFLPLVVPAEAGGVSPESVSAEAYGAFLCTIFDEWIREDISRIYVQIFDEAARPYRGLEHSVCTLRKTCGELPVLEHNGDLYSCDHYVDREHYIGNIGERSLVELLESTSQRAFGQSKWDSLPRSCRRCKVLEFCNGGCPKDRFNTTRDGEPGLDYLCAAFTRFHNHARSYLRRLASFIQTGQPVEQFSELVRSGYAKAPAAAGRNDPYPCGSGKKFKKCCGASG